MYKFKKNLYIALDVTMSLDFYDFFVKGIFKKKSEHILCMELWQVRPQATPNRQLVAEMSFSVRKTISPIILKDDNFFIFE